jgi:hypothetical protein
MHFSGKDFIFTFILLLISATFFCQPAFTDPCPVAKRSGDFDLDGFINFTDFAYFSDKWLDTDCGLSSWCDCADIDVSNDVTIEDLDLFVDCWDTAVFDGTIALGRPTDSNITLNVLLNEDLDAYFEYGTASDTYTSQTSVVTISATVPVEVEIGNLLADTRYYYRMRFRSPGGGVFKEGAEYTFHTQRAPGSTFTFGIQGDSHPERIGKAFDPDLYTRTMMTVASDEPDFYIMLGDDFSIDKLDPCTITFAQVAERYTLQRPYLGLISNSVPLFLVNGNHEQAARYLLDGTPDSPAVWAQNARNMYYPQPAPDGFYTGNTEIVPHIGLLRNHFAWTWGDALFVTIDPFWSSPVVVDNDFYGGPKTSDKWDITHGDAQYQWLKQTLEQSTAKWKFVIAHHVNGGSRGGTDIADQFEWGGYNKQGGWEFDTERPGWALPIHDVMAQNGVTIFFQGHDHIFVKQDLDGVIYQTLPYPADSTYALYNADRFDSPVELPGSGYARVTVSASSVQVDYVRTYLPKDETVANYNGQIAYTYTVTTP